MSAAAVLPSRHSHPLAQICCAIRWLLVVLLGALALPAHAQPGEMTDQQLFFQAAYLREQTDQLWHVRISGRTPSLAGCYVIIHDAAGRILLQRHIPTGLRPADAPLEIPLPPDGVTGDYRLVVVGFQSDIALLNLPLTDLPLETYGHTFYAARPTARMYFQTTPGQEQVSFYSRNGAVRVLQGDTVLADGKTQGQPKGSVILAPTKVQPGVWYEFQPYGTFYFGVEEGAYLVFDRQRWFAPDPRLEAVKWWQALQP